MKYHILRRKEKRGDTRGPQDEKVTLGLGITRSPPTS
jgi:hypothetical protein